MTERTDTGESTAGRSPEPVATRLGPVVAGGYALLANMPDRSAGSATRAKRVLVEGPGAGDYLLVSPEVRAAVERDMEYARSRSHGQELPPEVATRQLHLRALAAHYDGQNIAYIADTNGVVVLAVGLDEVNRLINEIPYPLRKDVTFTTPEIWW